MRLAWVLVLLPGMAAAQDWQRLDGDQIGAVLTARLLGYAGGITQAFNANGTTIYDFPNDESTTGEMWGLWKVDGNRYCSIWQQSSYWQCYRVDQAGPEIRFRDTSDSDLQTIGRLIDAQ